MKTLPLILALLLAAPMLQAQAPQTVIDSDHLDMIAAEDSNSFVFTGNVVAKGQGLLLHCDRLEVIAFRAQGSTPTLGRMEGVQSLVATGNVRIDQAGRTAYADRVDVTPADGLVVLSGKPSIVDSKASVEGWKIIYNSKTRMVNILPEPAELALPGQPAGRSRLVLAEEAIPKLDYDSVLQGGHDEADKPKAPEGK